MSERDALAPLARLALHVSGATVAAIHTTRGGGVADAPGAAPIARSLLGPLSAGIPLPGGGNGRLAVGDIALLRLSPDDPWFRALTEAKVRAFACVVAHGSVILVGASEPRDWSADVLDRLVDLAVLAEEPRAGRGREIEAPDPADFRRLVEDAPEVVLRLDAHGRVTYANPVVRRYTGMPPEALVAGWTANRALTRRFRARWRRATRRVYDEGEAAVAEFEIDSPDGRRVFECRFAPHLGADGRVDHVVAVAHDITALKRTEATLRLSELRLRRMLESTAIGVSLVDPSGVYVDVNRAFAEMLGYTQEELRGLHYGAVTLPEDLERTREMHEALFSGKRTRSLFEKRYRRKNGSTLWARLSAAVVVSGSDRYTVGLVEDITARKAAEEALKASELRFRSLIERSSDLIAVLEADGTVLYQSATIEDMLGYSADDVVGRNIFDRIHPSDVGSVRVLWAELLEHPDRPVVGEFRFAHADASWRTLHATAQNRLADPTVGGIVVNTRDVTAARELEAQLMQSQKMEAVGRLAGGIAHDFNNILTAVQGHAAMLAEELPADSPHRPDVVQIQKSAERAAALTRHLLAFSRRQVLQPKVLDLNAIVVETDKMLRRLIGEDIELRTELEPELGRIKADPAQVQQILLNLAVNARDAMAHGGILEIHTADVEVDELTARGLGTDVVPGSYVSLTVTDTGSGIEPAIVDHIFEPFFTTKEPGQGTGLGLSSVYGTVRQSGGYIWVETAVGHGTMFRIYMPRVEAEVEESPETSACESSGTGVILLVEDEPAVRALARRVLERTGYLVLEASDGEDALRVCFEYPGPIDLILSDVVMPRLGGGELADRIAALRPDTRVLLMSGYTRDALAKRGVMENVGFLGKPFSPELLRRSVSDALAAETAPPDA